MHKKALVLLQNMIIQHNICFLFLNKTTCTKALYIGDQCQEQVEALLRESVNMKAFKHPNVMGLIGVCLDMGRVPYIVLPFMSGGDLLTHVQQKQLSLVVECSENEEMVCSYFTLHY